MPEKTGSAKGHSSVLDTLERFLERIDDEPENAAHFAQKNATDVADSLGDQNWWISLCHCRERWPYLSAWKRANFAAAAAVKALKRFDIMVGHQLHLALMKLAGAFAANCFFAFMLFSAGALAFAQEQSTPEQTASKVGPQNQPDMGTKKIGLVIHGGAGTIERSKMTPEKEREYRAGLERALTAGYEILKRAGSSLDATEAAVRVLEDDPHFNAGKGSVFTSAGTNEMDASIMDGKTLKAGAVACVRHIKNPISLARLLMEKAEHVPTKEPRVGPVLMVEDGAEAFAKENGIELVDEKYFFTQQRWDALQKIKEAEKHGGVGGKHFFISEHDRHGTVGSVALDKDGNLAAATSTGGTTNKLPGRIGDTPVIGAGTYANNQTCAVSCTGDGEYFIRVGAAHEISALIEYRGMKLQEAAQTALDDVKKLGGTGGLIAIDKNGEIALPFNTNGMYRAYVDRNGKFVIEIYK
jgi:beta-aspartyl-peptidase (threonine type)